MHFLWIKYWTLLSCMGTLVLRQTIADIGYLLLHYWLLKCIYMRTSSSLHITNLLWRLRNSDLRACSDSFVNLCTAYVPVLQAHLSNLSFLCYDNIWWPLHKAMLLRSYYLWSICWDHISFTITLTRKSPRFDAHGQSKPHFSREAFIFTVSHQQKR